MHGSLRRFLALSSLLFAAATGSAEPIEIASPDNSLTVSVTPSDATGNLSYSLRYQDMVVVSDSRLGLELKDMPPLGAGLAVEDVVRREHAQTWEPVYGQWARIPDNYHEMCVHLREGKAPGRRLTLTVRAYDEGMAFRYEFPEQAGLDAFVIRREHSQFRFTANHRAWAVYSAQGEYEAVPLNALKPDCERPLVIEVRPDLFVAVGEAALVDYARMRLAPVRREDYTLESQLASPVKATAPFTTPWRTVAVGNSPGQLIERSYLTLNLNAPCAIADTSWIKPGKVIREVTLTTEGGRACVDFAVARNLQYIEFDAGWYGHEYDDSSDATTVTVDPKRSKGPLDLPAVIRYAESKNIGVLLYVNRRALERQLDEILPLLASWGVKGVKYGFVQVGSQEWTAWLHRAVRKAAEHRLMVDVHDEYRPTGYSRTYPNLMTQEGIHGDECMPTAENNAVLPFTRGLCGAGDHTICWYTDRVKNTWAHQLAQSVVFYSPLQFLYWYDQPKQFGDEPAADFFRHVPAVWDDLRVVNGAIGEYVTLARRDGDAWYLGTLNAVKQRTLAIPLDFLEPGRTYQAEVYADAAPQGGDRTGVTIHKLRVDAATLLDANLAANGGHAIRITPVK